MSKCQCANLNIHKTAQKLSTFKQWWIFHSPSIRSHMECSFADDSEISNWITDILQFSECKEYSKYVYVNEPSPVMSVSSQMDLVSKCGIVETPLIVGGQGVNEIEFPHMVSTEWVEKFHVNSTFTLFPYSLSFSLLLLGECELIECYIHKSRQLSAINQTIRGSRMHSSVEGRLYRNSTFSQVRMDIK